LNPLHAKLRNLLGLPQARAAVRATTEWLELSDGVRLATSVIQPVTHDRESRPVLLIRTPRAALKHTAAARFFANRIAQSGYTVVLQECRGCGSSEGRFAPFVNEQSDGAETLAWIAEQAFGRDGIGLFGFGYAGHAAWAAQAAAPDHVSAIAVGFHARDPYSQIYSGGALQLDSTLRFSLVYSETPAWDGDIDFDRGLRHRPLCEADRVAFQRSDSWREFLAHPRHDEYWAMRMPELPSHPPATLLLAGWYDTALPAQLADHAALVARSRASESGVPELLIGPWAAGREVNRRRLGRRRNVLLDHLVDFFDRRLRGSPTPTTSPVRVFTIGEGSWRDLPSWPPTTAHDTTWYLRAVRETGSPIDDGALSLTPPAETEAPKHIRANPEDPVPSIGGALQSSPGPADQRSVEARADVLCYSSSPLDRDVLIAGPVHLELHVAASAPDADFCAKLVDVATDGTATIVCDGIIRARRHEDGEDDVWFEAGEARRLKIMLSATTCLFRAGHRIRLEVATANFPRFDRNPHSRESPANAAANAFEAAQVTIMHDALHASQLTLPTIAD
jgi:putative CocE/NonD family hydrolase